MPPLSVGLVHISQAEKENMLKNYEEVRRGVFLSFFLLIFFFRGGWGEEILTDFVL